EILRRLQAQRAAGKPIIGTGAGTGISAKFEEAGGTDLIIIYNSARYRMAGRGSLGGLMAYGDANAIVMEMAGEVLPVVKNTPVLAGVNGTDPFRVMPYFLKQVKDIGMIGMAHELDLFTSPYVFNPDEARAMTNAGADLLVCHLGLTTAGTI